MSNQQYRQKFKRIQSFGYIIENKLGMGAIGQVYEAFKEENYHRQNLDEKNKKVALKFISKASLKTPFRRRLIDNEIRTLQSLNGVSEVIDLYEVLQSDQDICLVLELCQKDNLRAEIKKGSKGLEEAIMIMKQIVSGYLELFKKRIIHRDLKPSNILLNKEGKVKIADFGFAIFEHQLKKQGQNNVGSKFYMPPEVIRNNSYSYKSDIWSIGVIFYQLLCGKRPWSQKNQNELLKFFERMPIEKLIPSSISESAKQFLKKTIQPNVQKRANPQELMPLLENMISKGRHKLRDREIAQKSAELICIIDFCRLKFNLIEIADKQHLFVNILKPCLRKRLRNYLLESIERSFNMIENLFNIKERYRQEFKVTEDFIKIRDLMSYYNNKYFKQYKEQGKSESADLVNEVLFEMTSNIKVTNQFLVFVFYDYLISMKWLDDYLEKEGIKAFENNIKIEEITETLKKERLLKTKKTIKKEDLLKLENKLRRLCILK